MGIHNETLADSLAAADHIWMYRPPDMGDALVESLAPLGKKLSLHSDYDDLVSSMSRKVQGGDQVVFMSNGGFGSARQTLTALLQRTRGS